jgi:hypothetical protein
VKQLIAEGAGSPFAPAGRIFREWVEINEYDEASWIQLLRLLQERMLIDL